MGQIAIHRFGFEKIDHQLSRTDQLIEKVIRIHLNQNIFFTVFSLGWVGFHFSIGLMRI
jgi:hypothetical protein